MPETKISILTEYLNTSGAIRYRRLRHIKDYAMRYIMAVGGLGVIMAIILIAFYLFWVVLPMFRPAQINLVSEYTLPGSSPAKTLYYAMEEQSEIGLRISADGELFFFNTAEGSIIKHSDLLTNTGSELTSFSAGDPVQQLLAFGLQDGSVLLVKHAYRTTYTGNDREITPYVNYPAGEKPVVLDNQGKTIELITAQSSDDQTTIVGLTQDSRLLILNLYREESFLSDEINIIETRSSIPVKSNISHIILDVDQRELYLADDDGYIFYYDVTNKETPRLVQKVRAVSEGVRITDINFLSGGISVLVGDTSGRITQWFPVRDTDNNYTLERIRGFRLDKYPVSAIFPEYFRKGFLVVDTGGNFGIYHATAHRLVKKRKIHDGNIAYLAVAPRADAALTEFSGKLGFWEIDNEHPEVSWRSIWGKVWYESRDKPEYIWQSSSASSDFEPKFSLTPLAYGTIKASIYAMLFAIPLSIMGAIYTAYFMAPRMRNMVKPTIEIMAALPTVILGFLAGLWFAPLVERNLPGMLLLFAVIPASVLVAAWLWRCLPATFRVLIPDGWEAALLIPVIIFAVIIAFWLGRPLELWMFEGNMPLWLNQEWGITYDQRNSFVVGIAIGFAVIPTIFSISEDAIFGVPGHLTTGSLALGATPWQTMVGVVLLTASPGIFSAVMIGLGRAVGETMIVVMATGNTAIMDMNIFQGFRALSANIAVEMPESELGSTHYRILFLAGLVLFMATFVFNTVAEVVRQRLRVKYSSL